MKYYSLFSEKLLVASCGGLCSLTNLCEGCRTKKDEFRKNYHLVNNVNWFSIISRKFNKCKLVWLIYMITIYSSYDFEVLLRELYEKVYEIICDSGHEFWKNKITKKSITHQKIIVSNKYWYNLIFKICELK